MRAGHPAPARARAGAHIVSFLAPSTGVSAAEVRIRAPHTPAWREWREQEEARRGLLARLAGRGVRRPHLVTRSMRPILLPARAARLALTSPCGNAVKMR